MHHFDIMRSLAGSNARTVHALTWNPDWSEFHGDAQGLILLEMENGVKVFYEGAKANASQLNGWGDDYWRAECGSATLELDRRELRVIRENRETESLALANQDAWKNAWLAELFCEWLRGESVPPNNLDDNIQCAALLFAAIESAHSGAIVDVQEFLCKHTKDVERSHAADADKPRRRWTEGRRSVTLMNPERRGPDENERAIQNPRVRGGRRP